MFERNLRYEDQGEIKSTPLSQKFELTYKTRNAKPLATFELDNEPVDVRAEDVEDFLSVNPHAKPLISIVDKQGQETLVRREDRADFLDSIKDKKSREKLASQIMPGYEYKKQPMLERHVHYNLNGETIPVPQSQVNEFKQFVKSHGLQNQITAVSIFETDGGVVEVLAGDYRDFKRSNKDAKKLMSIYDEYGRETLVRQEDTKHYLDSIKDEEVRFKLGREIMPGEEYAKKTRAEGRYPLIDIPVGVAKGIVSSFAEMPGNLRYKLRAISKDYTAEREEGWADYYEGKDLYREGGSDGFFRLYGEPGQSRVTNLINEFRKLNPDWDKMSGLMDGNEDQLKYFKELHAKHPNPRDFGKWRKISEEDRKRYEEAGLKLSQKHQPGRIAHMEAEEKKEPGTYTEEDFNRALYQKEKHRIKSIRSKYQADQLRYKAEMATEFLTPEWTQLTESPWQEMGASVGSGMASLALAAGGQAAAPGFGIFLLSSLDAMGNYDEAREAGLSALEAMQVFTTSWAASAGMEWMPFEVFKSSNHWLTGFLTGALAEGLQESSQEIALNIVAQQSYDPDRKWNEGVSEAALGGIFSGGLMGAVSGALNSRRDGYIHSSPDRQMETSREVNSSLSDFGADRGALRGLSFDTKQRVLAALRIGMDPDSAYSIIKSERGRALYDKLYNESHQNFNVNAEGIKPTFKVPMRARGNNQVVAWGDTEKGGGRTLVDPNTGIKIRRTGKGDFTVINIDGSRLNTGSVNHAIEIAENFSIHNQRMDAQRQVKAQYLQNLHGRLAGNVNVEVYDNIQKLAEHHPEVVKHPDFSILTGALRLPNGNVVFILDNLATPYEMIQSMLHEAGVHHGLRSVFTSPESRENILNNLDKSTLRYGKSVAEALGYDINTVIGLEEMLAYANEHRSVHPTAYDKAVYAVREQLRKMFPNMNLNEREVATLVNRMQRSVKGLGGDLVYVQGSPGSMTLQEQGLVLVNESERVNAENEGAESVVSDEATVDESPEKTARREAWQAEQQQQQQQERTSRDQRRAVLQEGMDAHPVETVRADPTTDSDIESQEGVEAAEGTEATERTAERTPPAPVSEAQETIAQFESDERLKKSFPVEYEVALEETGGDEAQALSLLREEVEGAKRREAKISEHDKRVTISEKLQNNETLTAEEVEILADEDVPGTALYARGYRRQRATGDWVHVDNIRTPQQQHAEARQVERLKEKYPDVFAEALEVADGDEFITARLTAEQVGEVARLEQAQEQDRTQAQEQVAEDTAEHVAEQELPQATEQEVSPEVEQDDTGGASQDETGDAVAQSQESAQTQPQRIKPERILERGEMAQARGENGVLYSGEFAGYQRDGTAKIRVRGESDVDGTRITPYEGRQYQDMTFPAHEVRSPLPDARAPTGTERVQAAIMRGETNAELKRMSEYNRTQAEVERGAEAEVRKTLRDDDIRFRKPVDTERDRLFAEAEQKGDVETAQQMVDEEARKKGYIFHRGKDPRMSPWIIQFADDPNEILHFGDNQYVVHESNLEHSIPKFMQNFAREYYREHLESSGIDADTADTTVLGLNPERIVDAADAWDDANFLNEMWAEHEDEFLDLIDEGKYGFKTRDGGVLWQNPDNRIKIADAFTYDDNGKLIPLSERFNVANDDVRFRKPVADLMLRRDAFMETSPEWGKIPKSQQDNTRILSANNISDTQLDRIQKQYEKFAKRADITPTDLKSHIMSGNGLVWKPYGVNDYFVGQFIGDTFAVSHIAPESMRSGIAALTDLLYSSTPVVFAVPENLASQLSRIGFKEANIVFPMEFKGDVLQKHLLVNESFAPEHLTSLISWYATELENMGIDPDEIRSDVNNLARASGVTALIGESMSDMRFRKPIDAAAIEQAQREYAEVESRYKGTDQWMKAPNGKDTNLTEQQWVQVRTPNFIRWFGDWQNDPNNASKVVDENGEPKVVYHGSRTSGRFSVFSDGNAFFVDSRRVAEMFASEANYVLFVDGDQYDIGQWGADNIREVIEPYESLEWHTGWNLLESGDSPQEVIDRLNDAIENGGIQAGIDSFNGAQEVRIEKGENDIFEAFLNIRNPMVKDFKGKVWTNDAELLPDGGQDGSVIHNIVEGGGAAEIDGEAPPAATDYITISPNQIKSATDNIGTFDSADNDILFRKPVDSTTATQAQTEQSESELRASIRDNLRNDPVFRKSMEQDVSNQIESVMDEMAREQDEYVHSQQTQQQQDSQQDSTEQLQEQVQERSAPDEGFTEIDGIRFRKPISNYQTVRKAISDLAESFGENAVEVLTDSRITIQTLYDEIRARPGAVYIDKDHAYNKQAERRNSFFENKQREFTQKFFEPAMRLLEQSKFGPADLDAYIQAKHAKTFNQMIAERRKGAKAPAGVEVKLSEIIDPELAEGLENDGWAGKNLSDESAERTLAWYETMPHADKLMKAAELFVNMNRAVLDLLVENGLMHQEQAEAWKRDSPYYVPLKVAQDTDVDTGLSQGFVAKESHHAKGHFGVENESSVINSLTQMDSAIMRGLRNVERNRLWNFLKANPDDSQYVLHDEVPYKEAPVKNKKTGEITVQYIEDQGFKKKQNVVPLKVNGDVKYIEFKGPKQNRLGEAVTEENIKRGGKVLNAIKPISNFWGQMRTTWVLDFALRNGANDFLEAAAIMLAEGYTKEFRTVIREFPNSWATVGKYVFGKNLVGKEANLWKLYVEHGGQLASKFADTQGKQWAKEIDAALGIKHGNKTTRAIQKVISNIENINEVIEVATRYSVFKGMLEGGMNAEDAAIYARNITVDFDKKGTWTPMYNTIWKFSSVAIQGNYRFMKAVVKNKHGRRLVAGVTAMAFLNAMWNMMSADDDDDDYMRIEDWEKRSKIITRIPFTGTFIKVPSDRMLGFFWANGTFLAEAVMGRRSPGSFVNASTSALVDRINPIGGGGHGVQALFPTLAQPFAQVWLNKDWRGRPIVPGKGQPWNAHVPPSELSYRHTSKGYKLTARYLNMMTGGDKYTAGRISISPEEIRHWIDFVTGSMPKIATRSYDAMGYVARGEDIPWHRVPFVRDFTVRPSEFGRGSQYYPAVDRYSKAVYRFNAYTNLKDKQKVVKENPFLNNRTRIGNTIKRIGSLQKRQVILDSDGKDTTKIDAEIDRLMKAVIDSIIGKDKRSNYRE